MTENPFAKLIFICNSYNCEFIVPSTLRMYIRLRSIGIVQVYDTHLYHAVVIFTLFYMKKVCERADSKSNKKIYLPQKIFDYSSRSSYLSFLDSATFSSSLLPPLTENCPPAPMIRMSMFFVAVLKIRVGVSTSPSRGPRPGA